MLDITKFDPQEAQLREVLATSELVPLDDPEAVKEFRFKLRDLRTGIVAKAEEFREEAVKFANDVRTYQKKLVGLIEPVESKFETLYENNKLKEAMEKRKKELPSRRAALDIIGDAVEVSDEELLMLDDNKFNAYRLQRLQGKIDADRRKEEEARAAEEVQRQADRVRVEAEQRRVAEEQAAKQRELDAKQAEIDKENARIEGERRGREEAERKMKQQQEDEARAKKEAEDKKLRENTVQAFLEENHYSEANGDKLIWEGKKVTLYKPVAFLNLP